MVFCGKPSGGCHACRARKTRCDQVPEGCTQCKKAKRVCPGYRNPGDLIFRDESTNVVHKIKAKEAREAIAKKKSASPALDDITLDDETPSVSSETSLEVVQQDNSPLAIEYALAPTLEDRAASFFVFNYVMGPNGPTKGYLHNLVELSQTQTLEDSLTTSMRAVGLAAYAHSAKAPSLLQNARYQYMKAIQLTNAALRSPEDVTKDSTLMAIQVLGIFETITGCKQRSFKDWSEHLFGAAAVIKQRGPEQIKTRGGRHMLIQLTSSLMIVCIQGRKRLPEHIREYMKAAVEYVKVPEASFRLQESMMLYTDLNADICEGILTDPEAIISKYMELDGVMLDIETNIPPGWEIETVNTDVDSDYVYKGQYHVYYDHWIAQMWNALRTLRAMLNERTRDILLEGFSCKPPRFTQPVYVAQFQLSTETLYRLQDDILLSVYQHMCRGRPLSKDATLSRREAEEMTPVPMSGGAFLMWPLWFVGVMDIATTETRGFVIKNLHNIADVLGIQQARVLANSVATQSAIKSLTEGQGLVHSQN